MMISDIHEGRLEKAVETLRAETGLQEVYGKLANVTEEADVQALIDDAEDKLGGVDVLINNAGLGGTKLLVDMEDDEWSRVLDITLTGTMRMTRAMLKKCNPRRWCNREQCLSVGLACPERTVSLRRGQGLA